MNPGVLTAIIIGSFIAYMIIGQNLLVLIDNAIGSASGKSMWIQAPLFVIGVIILIVTFIISIMDRILSNNIIYKKYKRLITFVKSA